MMLLESNASRVEEYSFWIEKNYPTRESCHLKCAEATLEMQKVFPHLTRHRGQVFVFPCVWVNHWWLKDGDEVIDPTEKQFALPPFSYHEFIDEPTGKCLNCGELCFGTEVNRNPFACSSLCKYEISRSLSHE